MPFSNKKLRYLYWFLKEFIRKNLKLILLTFFLSFITVFVLVSFYPVIESQFLLKKRVVGYVGKYNLNSLPDEITSKISSGLIFINNEGQLLPALASSWEMKNNGAEFLVHLKPNFIWNDGKKFTAYDINYQFKDVKINVKDNYTLVFKLKNPLPIFIQYLNKPVIKRPLVGVGGLYRTGKIVSKNEIIKELYLIPNKKGLSTLIYRFYDNDNQLIIAYKKGEILEFSSTKKALIEPFYQWKNSQVERLVDYKRLFTLFFNFNNQILKERDLRAAIKLGINPDKFKDYGQPALGPIPPTSWAFNSLIKPHVYDYDTAKKIISNTISASMSAKLNILTYYEYSDLADIILQQLKDLGFNPSLNYLTQTFDKNFDILLAYWKIPDDPDQYYFWHSSQNNTNIGNYSNLRVDKLLEDGRNTYITRERIRIYREFQKVISDDPPAVFLFYPYLYTVRRKS